MGQVVASVNSLCWAIGGRVCGFSCSTPKHAIDERDGLRDCLKIGGFKVDAVGSLAVVCHIDKMAGFRLLVQLT